MIRLSILMIAAVTAWAAAEDTPAEYRFDNGLWLNGEAFRPQTVYIVNGVLKFSEELLPAENTIDLDGGYVVPPFCEGHNHNIGGSADGLDEVVQAYLKDGVFYAAMPGSFALYRSEIKAELNHSKSMDVSFANNGLTGAGGHPRGLRESLMERFGLYPEFTKDTLPDKGYFEAGTLAELHEKWALIRDEQPDFVKAMLYYSEEYEERKDDPEYFGRRGLNPELLPVLVRLAHGENLRVAVHVETETDMVTALKAGADIIAHLPSYDSTVRLSDETIRLTKETEAALVTTMTVAKRIEQSSPGRYAEILDAQRDNLARLQDAGVTLVVGSDNVRDTSRAEAMHLAGLGVLTNRTLLAMWTENCARMAFPGRPVGRLADGYEASFLVLEGDPLADFSNTGGIVLRVKDGELLDIEG